MSLQKCLVKLGPLAVTSNLTELFDRLEELTCGVPDVATVMLELHGHNFLPCKVFYSSPNFLITPRDFHRKSTYPFSRCQNISAEFFCRLICCQHLFVNFLTDDFSHYLPCSVFGLDESSLEGKSLFDCVHVDDIAPLYQSLQRRKYDLNKLFSIPPAYNVTIVTPFFQFE